jgi:hypothetical protein
MAALFFCQAIAQTFEAKPGFVRKRMVVLTAIAAACLVLTPVIGIGAVVWMIASKQVGLGGIVLRVAVWLPLAVVLYSSFSDNIREWLEQRRPDQG